MQENKKTIKLQKVGTIALLCLLVVAFVGSIFCALILPFANVNCVASAESILPSTAPHLGDLESGTSVYGLFVDTNNINQSILSNFSSLSNTTISVTFLGESDPLESALRLFCGDMSDPIFSLYFSYLDFTGASSYNSVQYPLGSNIFTNEGDEIKGLGYCLFDKPFVYTAPTDSNALTLCELVYAIVEPLNSAWSPEAFAIRFVTPTDSPSNTVFFNLDTMPKAPKEADFKTYSSGSIYWAYYDYFQEYGTDGSMISANDVETVGWHMSVVREGMPMNPTIVGYNVSLRIGRTDIYSYYVSGSDFDTGTISKQKWLVASNYTFGNMKLYKYDFSGASSYYTLLPHEEGKVRPVDSQFGEGGWNSWLALFDLSNFVSMSNDVYINLGYQNAKAYYDELIKTKSQEAFLQGKNQGYEAGFQEGKLQGGNYTFTSLIGAVFDAPIEAFRGLFNFEILGTNMQGFVLALLTLSVIIVVIKFALGGK